MNFRFDDQAVFLFLKWLETLAPGTVAALVQQRRDGCQRFFTVTQYGYVNFYILVDFSRINVKVYLLACRA